MTTEVGKTTSGDKTYAQQQFSENGFMGKLIKEKQEQMMKIALTTALHSALTGNKAVS